MGEYTVHKGNVLEHETLEGIFNDFSRSLVVELVRSVGLEWLPDGALMNKYVTTSNDKNFTTLAFSLVFSTQVNVECP